VVSEPTPTQDTSIPDVVLNELRSAFSDELASDPSSPTAATSAGRAAKERKKSKKPKTKPAKATKPGRRERRALAKAERAAKANLPEPGDTIESVRVVPAAPTSATSTTSTTSPTSPTTTKSPKPPKPSKPAIGTSSASPPAGGPARSTIVIGGDDLPDAVYLDEDAEPRLKELYGGETDGGSGSIILGNELDSSGAFDAVSPPARSMDPRVRARRLAVKRAASRKRLIWAGVVVVLLLLAVGALAVFASSLFAVRADDVEITGAVYTDPAELQAIVQTVVGDPVLLVDTQALETRIEQLPWVERAVVTTDFPHHLGIDIRERLPLATFVGTDGKYRVIDRDGRVLAVLDNQPVAYMLLTGDAPDTDAGALAGRPFANAAQLVGALPSEIRAITSSLSVDASTGDLGLLLQPDIPVRLGGFGDIETKLARLLQYMRGEGGLSACKRIDVSTGEVSCATR